MPTLTYEAIASTTINTAVSSFTFSNISQTYTDLVLVVNAAGSIGVDPIIRVNSDSGSNYSVTHLTTNGGAVSGQRFGSQTSFSPNYFGSDTTVLGTNARSIYIFDYSSTSKYKGLTATGGQNQYTDGETISCGQWRSNTAITSITYSDQSYNIVAGSQFSLYGIKAGT